MSTSMAMSGAASSRAPSAQPEIDAAIAALRDHAREFARLPVSNKAALLRECIPRLLDVAPAWVADGCTAKGLSIGESGEEWLSGPVPTIRGARLLANSLDDIARMGRPQLGTGVRTGRDGRLRVELFPVDHFDKLLFGGFSAYALMEEGIDRKAAARRQASFYQESDPEGGVSLILGAGNVSSIPPLDVFTKMFAEGYVCLLKMNPVNEWVGPHLERALAPLVSRGFLRVVYGGAETGKYAVEHEGVDDVHITGSDRTHDLIVWGPPGPERERRMRDNEPLLDKPITSELGNVSPVAIVPFSYSDDELWFQARNVASMVVNNGSFNCNAAKMLITSRDWAQRETFLSLVAKALSQVPTRRAYYPGAFDRYRALTSDRSDIARFGRADDQHLAWAFIRNVDATDGSDPLFSTEPFCGILSETSVGTGDPVEFLDAATSFMNDRLWGTLNASLIIHPRLEKDGAVGAALDRAIRTLRYGTVAINHWPALGYAFGTTPWGGHQSANLKDIQSGLGWVHNTFMLDGIDKAVVRGPLKVWPHPVWFYDHRRAHEVGPRLAAFEADPSWRRLPGLVARAIRA